MASLSAITRQGTSHFAAAIVLAGSLLSLFPKWAEADVTVAYTNLVEKDPAVASNWWTGEAMVAYLVDPLQNGKLALRVRRLDASGVPVGNEIAPYGFNTHTAIGRPAIEVFYDGFVVAVPVREADRDRVLVRRLDSSGNPASYVYSLFDDGHSWYYEGDKVSSLRIAPSVSYGKFTVTVQRSVCCSFINGTWGYTNSIWDMRLNTQAKDDHSRN